MKKIFFILFLLIVNLNAQDNGAIRFRDPNRQPEQMKETFVIYFISQDQRANFLNRISTHQQFFNQEEGQITRGNQNLFYLKWSIDTTDYQFFFQILPSFRIQASQFIHSSRIIME